MIMMMVTIRMLITKRVMVDVVMIKRPLAVGNQIMKHDHINEEQEDENDADAEDGAGADADFQCL